MKIIQVAFTAFLLIGLAGCATPPQVSQLNAPAEHAEIELKSKLSYKRVGGLLNVAWEEGLIPGVYVAEKENELGTFFRGPGRCVWLHNSMKPELTVVRPGGIWIPRDINSAPKLYFYIEGSTYQVSNIDEYIAARQRELGQEISAIVTDPLFTPFANALLAASLEANKDIPNMNLEIVDKEFIQTIMSSHRTR